MKNILLIVIALLLFTIPVAAQTTTTPIKEQDGITTLKHWTFYDQALLVGQGTNGEQVTIPHRWGNLFGNKNGYGTYVMTLQFDESLIGELYALHIPYTASAYTLFFNGTEQVKMGDVAASKEAYTPRQKVMTHYFTINEPEIVVSLQVANFSNMVGGAEREITIGPRTLIMHNYQAYTNKENFILGGFLFMILNVLTLFYFRRQDSSYLWVGLIGFFLMLWYVLSKDHLVMDAFPNFSWEWMTKLEILTVFLAFSCYNKYISIVYSGYYNPKIPVYSMISFGILAILTLFISASTIVTLFNISSVCIVLFAMHVVYMSYCAIRDKKPYAVAIALTNAAFFIPFIQDMLYIQGFINTNYYSIYGFMFFALGYLITLNHQHTKKYQESEMYNSELQHINHRLEETILERTKELREKNEQLELLTVRDGLTNIANRRYFDQQLAHAMDKVTRENITCSLIMFDIDFFKKYNDHYGHIGGDEVLKRVARITEDCVGEQGIVARYGGEEFGVILVNKTKDEAITIAEAIRQAIENADIQHVKSELYGVVTISIGVAQASTELIHPTSLIEAADAALYRAKNSGRNRVCCGGDFISQIL